MKQYLWLTIVLVSLIGLTTAFIGFYQSIKVTSSSTKKIENIKIKNSEALYETKKSNSLHITIMGDSIARGTGDETGRGFSVYLKDNFKSLTSKDIQVDNIGEDGLQSAGLLAKLQNEQVAPLLKTSDYIIISIGGNDIRDILHFKDLTRSDEFKNKLNTYTVVLKDIVTLIRVASPNVIITFVGLYNPTELDFNAENVSFLNTWNATTQKIIENDKNIVFVPTYDIYKYNLSKYLAKDGLHPNSVGYQLISSRISKSLEGLIVKN